MTDHIDDFIEYQREIQIIQMPILDESGDSIQSELSPTPKTVILIQANSQTLELLPEGADTNAVLFVWDKEKILELDQIFIYNNEKYIVVGIDDYKNEENLYRFRGSKQ